MLKLVLKEGSVYHGGVKLRINKQASKGPGNEVVWVGDILEANGQQWVSLSRLVEGENLIECKARIAKAPEGKNYILREDEKVEIARLQKQIEDIIEIARKRFVFKPKLDVDVKALTEEEKLAKLEEVKKFLGLV